MGNIIKLLKIIPRKQSLRIFFNFYIFYILIVVTIFLRMYMIYLVNILCFQ